MSVPPTVKNNPNASLSAAMTPVAALVVWVAGKLGAHLSATQSVTIAGGIIAAALWVGRAGGRAMAFFAKRGVCGVAHLIWKGDGQ